jgi:hypothetical protein
MCKDGKCEYNNELNRELEIKPTADETRFARLWAEVELPKQLKLTPEQYKQYLKENKQHD